MFWARHQETATDRQISAEIILGKVNDPSTPPQASQPAPPSPRTPLGPRRINTVLRTGELDPFVAVAQAQTAAEVAKSENVPLRKELEEARAAMARDQATRGGRKAVQDLGGGLYDPEYWDDNRADRVRCAILDMDTVTKLPRPVWNDVKDAPET
ncbi:hypothetical protein L202_01079 [Cryptococcus amylolentus CBS 6039]|uniref:Uncharacterized protein n=1 Tax=Cryptococcus amylolentus CBS 6039 TaxID=1295533 RepID=A0A1E3I2R8_9TREE|nr:hypothetical protein L202_01079 [Cryptococcus amylolentus CBS 6039]ODN82808.1 hypothetical protein L202_01079 [Cryptococcus amylolentus CBS 6039]